MVDAQDFNIELKRNGLDIDYAISTLIACFNAASLFRGQSPILGLVYGDGDWSGFRGSGLQDIHYRDLAITLAEQNADVKILSEDQYPFVAVRPEKIREITVISQQSVIHLDCGLSINHHFNRYAQASNHADHMKAMLKLHQDASDRKRLQRRVDGNVIYPNFGRK